MRPGDGSDRDLAARTATVFLPHAASAQTLADLRDNGRIAVTFSRALDHRSVQLQGTVRELRSVTAEEAAIQERYRVAFAEQVYAVGLPRAIGRRLAWSPATAIVFGIDELCDQTPGPRAGFDLAGRPS